MSRNRTRRTGRILFISWQLVVLYICGTTPVISLTMLLWWIIRVTPPAKSTPTVSPSRNPTATFSATATDANRPRSRVRHWTRWLRLGRARFRKISLPTIEACVVLTLAVVAQWLLDLGTLNVATAFAFLAQACIFTQLTIVEYRRYDLQATLGILATLLAILSARTGLSAPVYQSIAVVSLLVCLLLSTRGNRATPVTVMGRLPKTAYWLWLTIILASMLPMALALDTSFPAAQQFLIGVVEQRLQGTSEGRAFVRVATLSSVTRSRNINPRAVALRVYANAEPGYLRGRCFESFNGWNWQIPSQRRAEISVQEIVPESNPSPNEFPGALAQQPFFRLRSGTSTAARSLDIETDPVRGAMFFTPLQAVALQGQGKRLLVDENQIVREGLNHLQRYRILVADQLPATPLPDEHRQRLLSWDPNLAELQPLANDLLASLPGTLTKLRRLERFFQSEFEYSEEILEPSSGGNASPLVPFVRERRAAHCEYFATAAAMMLRMQAIPTRLIVGYRVYEMNDDSEYYVARNRNAHAWVEAYDDASKRWWIVEATPGYGSPELGVDRGPQGTTDNNARSGFEAEANNAGPAAWILRLQAYLRTITTWLLIAGSILAGGFVLLLAVRSRGTWRRTNTPHYRVPSDVQARLDQHKKSLRQALKQLNAFGLQRQPNESWWRLADRIAEYAQKEPAQAAELNKLSTYFRNYAQLRYHP